MWRNKARLAERLQLQSPRPGTGKRVAQSCSLSSLHHVRCLSSNFIQPVPFDIGDAIYGGVAG